jgi:hypothetical protein
MEYLLLLAQFTKEIEMGLFTNTEKKIAAAITDSFTKAEAEISKVEVALSADVKSTFDKAREEALNANVIVNKLKTELQDALVKARDAHQVAIDAARAAQTAAEADVEKFKAMVVAHTADLNTQSSQIAAPTPVTATVGPETPPQQQ